MSMTFIDLLTLPALLPVPQLDIHIIRRGKNKRECGMNSNRSNIVSMGFKLTNTFHGVVVENADFHILIKF